MKRWLPYLSLFTSASTLICCALPALFVTLGAGASLVGLLGAVPQLVWFSEHKEIVFVVGGALLALSGYLRWRARNDACPIDPVQAEACRSARDSSKWIFVASVVIYVIGAFFAFLAPLLL